MHFQVSKQYSIDLLGHGVVLVLGLPYILFAKWTVFTYSKRNLGATMTCYFTLTKFGFILFPESKFPR